MTHTETGLANTPTPEIIERIRHTAEEMEKVRALLGHSIDVNSGYRSYSVNKAVGGSNTSDHMNGDACDFTCEKFGTPIKVCRKIEASDLKFDQLIQEGTWVHLSFGPRMRQQVLTKEVLANGKTSYSKGLA